jgi:hypothetical protein
MILKVSVLMSSVGDKSNKKHIYLVSFETSLIALEEDENDINTESTNLMPESYLVSKEEGELSTST